MRSVSDGFLAASGRYYARFVLADGTEVESADIVSLTLTAACNGATDRLTLGASPAASLTGTLAGSRSDLEGQKLTLWLGRTVSGALEEYQMGVFTVTQATVSDGDTTTLLAYDANNVEMERTTYVPSSATTARAVLAEICTQAGLTLGDTGTLADADVSGYSLEGFTCRAMAGYMAALLGGNAVIDVAGQLCVRWFGDADVSLGPDEYYSGGLSLAAKDWSLDTLTCSVTSTATETTTDEDGNTTTAETSNTETLAWGLGSTGVELSNPWMTQAQLALIGADIGGMSYRSGTVSCLGDLRIEAGDTVTVTDSSGNRYAVPVMELSLTYDGGLKASIAAYAQTESDGGGSGSSGPLAETVNSLKVTVANIQNLTAENLTATNAKIANLTADYASLETVVAGKADIDDLTAATARITDLEADAITTGTLAAAVAKLGYLETDSLSAAVAELGYLTVSDAKLTYATIENLNAANLNITDLSADVANITTILAGNIGTGNLQTVHLTGENVVIDDAVITSAMIADLSASKLTAGTIYTSQVTIQSESGNLYITDNTIQIQDGTTVRVQIGEDASGDYNLYLWDAAGNLLWDAGGLYAAGIHDGIIRDIAVADDAAISGTKLDITSVASELNQDGSLVVDYSNVTINETTLSAWYATVNTKTDELTTTTQTLQTSLSEVQGQITAKVWQTDITDITDPLGEQVTTLNDQYAQLTLDLNSITLSVGDLTTTVSDNYETLEGKIATVETTASGISATVSALQSTVSDQGTSITEITGELSLKVDKDDNDQVVSMLNASSDIITLTANRLVIESTNLTLTADGILKCTDGEFSGKITATAGTIGGFTIGDTALYNSKSSLTSSTSGVYIGTDGISLGSGSTFKVTSGGAITASSGTIGGWSLNTYRLSASATIDDIDYRYYIQAAKGDGNSTYSVFGIQNTTDDVWPFRVYYNGSTVCTGLTDRGNLTVTGSVSVGGYATNQIVKIQTVSMSTSTSVADGSNWTVTGTFTAVSGASYLLLPQRFNYGYCTAVSYSGTTITATVHNASGGTHTCGGTVVVIAYI
ncbi:MAG: hypothetical protein LUG47_05285 [Clostridiales bacterium]|nr:hypothetical protein [Clostridiales bacterium]